jgi:uncharacterized phage protein gp47/JayE
VLVTIINAEKKGADTALIERTAAYIETQRPVGADVTVNSAAELPVQIFARVHLDGASISDAEAIAAEKITEHLRDIAFRRNYVSYAQIGSIIFDIAEIMDYSALTINGGIDNIFVPDNTVAVLGGVTFE